MNKTAEEMLSGEIGIVWKQNPNVTPGLAEKLEVATKKHHMTVEELREAADHQSAAKHN